MKRSLSILSGTDSGKTVFLETALFTIGRSGLVNLQLDDPLVSRRHLELKIEGDQVFAEDKSSHGSNLNGKRLRGIVSLSRGDILELGHVQLRYEELDDAPAVVLDDLEPLSSGMSGTKFMDRDEMDELRADAEDDAGPEATRAIVDGKTRMLDPNDLPKWKAPSVAVAPSRKTLLALFLLVCVCLGFAVPLWFVYGQKSMVASGDALERYTDPVYAFSVSYPDSWLHYPAKPDMPLIVGLGNPEADHVWTVMSVEIERNIRYEIMGLTEGFLQYQKSAKAKYEILGSKPMLVNEVSCIFYGFKFKNELGKGINGQGKGIYLLNGGTRMVVECYSAAACYQQQAPLFSKLLMSFSLSAPQQALDFPLPDDAMQRMALGDPELLARLIDEHKRNGDALVASRNVKQDNLYRAIQEYKQALQLSIARPERAKGYQDAACGLRSASGLFNQAIQEQRYEINRAMKEGDREMAYWAANKLLQMIPDKTDSIYQETYQLIRRLSLEK